MNFLALFRSKVKTMVDAPAKPEGGVITKQTMLDAVSVPYDLVSGHFVLPYQTIFRGCAVGETFMIAEPGLRENNNNVKNKIYEKLCHYVDYAANQGLSELSRIWECSSGTQAERKAHVKEWIEKNIPNDFAQQI